MKEKGAGEPGTVHKIIVMRIQIRKATLKDLPAILDLNNRLCSKEHKEFDATFDPEYGTRKGVGYFRKRISRGNGCAFVAVTANQTVGYLVGGMCHFSYRTVSIAEAENMFTLPRWRNRGIGTKLLKMFLAWAKKKKVKRVRIVASLMNTGAIALYKRAGFYAHDLALEKKI